MIAQVPYATNLRFMALNLSPSFIHRLMAVSSEKISLQNKILDLKKGFAHLNLTKNDLRRKKIISTPLMMENPVRSPIVPPMRLSWASVLIFLSLSISSKVAVSNRISTIWRDDWESWSPDGYICIRNICRFLVAGLPKFEDVAELLNLRCLILLCLKCSYSDRSGWIRSLTANDLSSRDWATSA